MQSASEFSAAFLKGLLSPLGIACVLGLWVSYHIIFALYNVSPLHPLSRFPGPKLAAASYAYEAYFDWWLVGRYSRRIRDMHERYGPIVRINPDELHCSDPRFVDEIYAGPGRVRDKWQHHYNNSSSGPPGVSSFSTGPHELHRMRRAAISKFFSRQGMLKLEDEIHDFAQQFVDKLLGERGKGPFDVREPLNCCTADVVSQYIFGKPLGFVAQNGWEPNFSTWGKSLLKVTYLARFSAVVRKLGDLPPWVANYLGGDAGTLMRYMHIIVPGYVKAALHQPEKGRLFAELADSKSLPESEKSVYRLSGEGFVLLLAGTETTSAILTTIIYTLLARPEIYARLMDDLQGADPCKLKWTDLERRPYLWAIIHETLRMMPGITHRSARIARDEDLIYKSQDGSVEWVIPKNTPMSMTSMINHWNEDLFPRPDEFSPERWLEGGQPNFKLTKSLLSFSRGSRSCVGENLALCEVYILTALLAFRVIPRARLYDTTAEDIMTYDHDLTVLQTKKGAISVKIQID